ncbi:PREDICTED: membrane-spanning 4-domains subfamily A member 4A [Cyprinodon variegatus]|uniref:membrane-spanning 4-domains subfamily A member 4A n=1 Tax=Cyprinodon variegatus TaxID=28743 RepID=UPI0007429F34|nr:PREDICTED: membrane-spanning 4-domains subfamily A member 4A [Cyprinodon variegatus]
MTSTSVTTVGGVVIITQVIPKDDRSIPLETSANPADQVPSPVLKTPPAPPKKDSKETIFLQGESMGLGVVQIFIGVLCVLFSLTVFFSEALIHYAPFGFGVSFVVSGSLALAAGRRTSVKLVWYSLVSNVFSVLLGLAGVIYDCFLLASGPTKVFCEFDTPNTPKPSGWDDKCSRQLWRLEVPIYGLLGFFLVLLVLQVCVSVTVCVFSRRVIRSSKHYFLMEEHYDQRSPILA